ncbi:hypothetical protein CsSME_00007883 [Camellia sinensis var. sinensis]
MPWFVFEGIDEGSLNGALDRAFSHIEKVHQNYINDHSWNKTAGKYLDMYNSIRVRG